MTLKNIIRPFVRLLKASWVFIKSTLHLPQKYEDHFKRLSAEPQRTDIEVDGFSKLTPDQLAAVKKGVYDDVLSYAGEGKVLDFGCGTGRHLLHFPPARYQRSGIDLNEGSLVRARAKLPGASFFNVNLLADHSFITASRGHYDLIYSVSVLEYFQKWELKNLFMKFFQLLKANGVVNLLFPTPQNVVDKWATDKYRKYSVKEISGLLMSSGFTILRADQLPGVVYTGRVLARKEKVTEPATCESPDQ